MPLVVFNKQNKPIPIDKCDIITKYEKDPLCCFDHHYKKVYKILCDNEIMLTILVKEQIICDYETYEDYKHTDKLFYLFYDYQCGKVILKEWRCIHAYS